MLPPPPLPVLYSSAILAPLFGAVCVRIAQFRYRGRLARKSGLASADVPTPPLPRACQVVLVAGVVWGQMGMAALPALPGRIASLPQCLFAWFALGAIFLAVLAAIVLAELGMRPEPNFKLDSTVDVSSLKHPANTSGKPAGFGAEDLFDPREL